MNVYSGCGALRAISPAIDQQGFSAWCLLLWDGCSCRALPCLGSVTHFSRGILLQAPPCFCSGASVCGAATLPGSREVIGMSSQTDTLHQLAGERFGLWTW